jgi:hypothetical protein
LLVSVVVANQVHQLGDRVLLGFELEAGVIRQRDRVGHILDEGRNQIEELVDTLDRRQRLARLELRLEDLDSDGLARHEGQQHQHSRVVLQLEDGQRVQRERRFQQLLHQLGALVVAIAAQAVDDNTHDKGTR